MDFINKNRSQLNDFIQAFRLAFVMASILPFIFGSFIDRASFNLLKFLLGLITVVTTHLGANLMNDYADSKSGVDWQDKNFYKFFGGSKLIQMNVFSEKFYLVLAIICFVMAGLCILLLAGILKNLSIIVFYSIILILGVSYSEKPLKLSYHRLGEPVIFILFGPALVMGAYFIQTEIFPSPKAFLLSVPFGLLTTAILFSNEIPDYPQDIRCGKITWVSFLGQEKSFILYIGLVTIALAFIILNIILRNLSLLSLLSLLCIFFVVRAAHILKNSYSEKITMIKSSKLTILSHTFVSAILILDILV